MRSKERGRAAIRGVGFFGPDSMMWHVAAEAIITLGTTRAILMQIAHPKVAQGVTDHSAYRREPIRRALRTYKAANAFIFGDTRNATEAAAHLHAMHKRIRGLVSGDVPGLPSPDYAATDQDLLLWVYATLVDTVLLTHDAFLGTLREQDREQYYQDSKVLARLFGIKASALPETLDDLRSWMADMLAGGQITVTPTARAIADDLQTSAWYLRLSRPLQYTLAVSTLPPQLRAAYGLREDRRALATYRAATRVLRQVLPRVPRVIRRSPYALVATWRYRRAARADATRTGGLRGYPSASSYHRERHWSSKPRLS